MGVLEGRNLYMKISKCFIANIHLQNISFRGEMEMYVVQIFVGFLCVRMSEIYANAAVWFRA